MVVGDLVNTLTNPTKDAVKFVYLCAHTMLSFLRNQIIATLQEAAVHKGMVICTNGIKTLHMCSLSFRRHYRASDQR